MTSFFQMAAGITRDEALTALKRRAEAEGLIITICGWCDAFMGEQPGEGVTGISTGICPKCEAHVRAENGIGSPLAAREGAAEDAAELPRRAEPEAVPSPFSADPLRSILDGLIL